MHRLAPVVVAVALLLFCVAAPAAIAQDIPSTAPVSEQVLDYDTVIDPTVEGEADTTPELPPEQVPDDSLPEDEDAEGNTSNSEIQIPGYGSAADQPMLAKRAEIQTVEARCQQDSPPPTSTMLGLPGLVSGDDSDSWSRLLIVIAGGLLVFAAITFLVKRRGWKEASMGPLSATSAVLGIVGVITGLAVQFIPGIGVHDPPPPEATMEVDQIHTRITRAEYATKTSSTVRLSREDRREVGNVIWVEVDLKGYEDKQPSLQYALYDSDAAGALLPGTAKRVPLTPQGKDVETLFVPIWVGYPKSRLFQAQFRLLEDERVQQMASTGKMRGSVYRYSCGEPV